MILAGSLEFDKRHNNEVQERPSDNIEIPKVFLFINYFLNYNLGK